jgi:hypothetical protein
MVAKRRSHVGFWAVMLAGAACQGDPAAPTAAACHSGIQPLALSVGADIGVDPLASGGCVIIAANGSSTDSAEYLLVPQVSTTDPDYHTSFRITGGQPILAAPPLAELLQAPPPSPAQQFHDRLRLMEQQGTYPLPAGPPPPGLVAPSVLGAGPADTVGNPRTFKVLSNITNTTLFNSVPATAKSVGTHIILYVDNAAPANGLTTADYDKLRSDFDTLLYAVDTTAFGRESDLDGNGRVIVLMTNTVNKLVTQAECPVSGFVTGFFFGADIAPATHAQWNNGEIFYSMIADSGATLSCSHPNSQVKRLIPVTFIHEFQHMISFNQHVLLRSVGSEALWLNEGMSHYAEERGGLAFLKAGDSTRFCEHVRGDLYNFGLYLTNPGSYPLVTVSGTGSLEERGAEWSFVRYLVDQFAADTTLAAADAFTRQMVQTSATGTDNVSQHTNQPFATLARRWVLANWASDLPGFAAPSTLKYKRWAFRSDFPALHNSCTAALPATFPLAAPGGPGGAISLTGIMWAGSAGAYQRALQGPGGAQFTLLFSDGAGALLQQSMLPRLNVLRIR